MNNNSYNIFSTAYLPPISVISKINIYKCIYIDIYENYVKQTFRNRCHILSANGKLSLSIPVKKVNGNHTLTKDIEIDNSQPWQKIHWRAIESAYSNSPFFLYYRDAFEPFYLMETKYLIDFNNELLNLILKLTGIKTEILFSEKYFQPSINIIDLRNSISPKKENNISSKKYNQVFSEKFDFINDLSIIDLLFNEGKFCKEYL
ncbi:MAG TPA: WbqC family protein [Bacteroidales bacterium]|nr:WbqC family protein [Bacteroidales bacterium]HPS16361.1 WbqC family protein [Bacteroidales bacterium]